MVYGLPLDDQVSGMHWKMECKYFDWLNQNQARQYDGLMRGMGSVRVGFFEKTFP
jgi:hypothetical protein